MFRDIKTIGKQASIYGIGTILTGSIGFLLIPLYTHYLSPKDYGILEMLNLAGNISAIFIAMGITNSILRFHGYYSGESDKEEVIKSAISFAVISGMFITMLLISTSTFFSNLIFKSSEYAGLFILLFINVFLAQIHTHCKTIFRVQGKPIAFISVSIITTVIAIAFNIYFIAILQIGIKGFYYSSIITFSVVTIILLLKQFMRGKIRISVDKIRQMLRYGVFFIPTLLIAFIINFSDRYFLTLYTDLETVGLYALGYKIGMITMFLLGSPFHQVWSAYAFEIEKKENAREIFSSVMTYYILICVFFALSVAILSREIISIIADPAYLLSYTVVPLIAFSAVFNSVNNLTQIGILIKQKTSYLPFINAFVAVINVVLNIYLIPKYGMIGAGVSTLISFMFLPIVSLWISQRMYPIQIEIGRILKILFLSMILYLVSLSFQMNSLMGSIMIKIMIIGSFPIGLLILNFFDDTEKAEIARIFIKLRLLNSRT